MTNRIDHVLLTNHLSNLVEEERRLTSSSSQNKNNSKAMVSYTTEPPESIKFEAMKSSSYRQKLYYKRLTNTLYGGDQRLNMSPHINLNILWHFINKLEYQNISLIVRNIKLGIQGNCL